jgi:hypothetical protein
MFPVIFSRNKKKAAGPTTLVYDTFTDTDATALASHTIAPTNTPATSWTTTSNKFAINSNRAVGTATAACFAKIDAGVSDCIIYARLAVSENSDHSMGIAARYADDSNSWLFLINPSQNQLQLYELTSTSYTLRASKSMTIDPGTNYDMVVTLSGNSLTVAIGSDSATYSSVVRNTATKCGIYAQRSDNISAADIFDEFRVTELT